MLPSPEVIDYLKRLKEKKQQEEEDQRPRLELPVPEYSEEPEEKKSDEETYSFT